MNTLTCLPNHITPVVAPAQPARALFASSSFPSRMRSASMRTETKLRMRRQIARSVAFHPLERIAHRSQSHNKGSFGLLLHISLRVFSSSGPTTCAGRPLRTNHGPVWPERDGEKYAWRHSVPARSTSSLPSPFRHPSARPALLVAQAHGPSVASQIRTPFKLTHAELTNGSTV